MKKLLLVAAIASIVFSSAAISYAATSGVVDVTVTIEQSISIVITGGPIDFGKLGVNEPAVSSEAVSVKNDGSGADETITLSVANPTGWTQGTPGDNVYRINFQFKETKPEVSDSNWKAPGDISETLAYDATKKLWMKLETPTVTDITTKQTIKVTITAG